MKKTKSGTMNVTAHPLRRAILDVMNTEGGEWSPATLGEHLRKTKEFKKSATLGNVSYHVKIMATAGAIHMIRTKPVRGALEHFYIPTVGVCVCCRGAGTLGPADTARVTALLEAEMEKPEEVAVAV